MKTLLFDVDTIEVSPRNGIQLMITATTSTPDEILGNFSIFEVIEHFGGLEVWNEALNEHFKK